MSRIQVQEHCGEDSALQEALNFIKTFGQSFGLSLNKDKSEAFWIGIKADYSDKPLGLKWSNNEIKCLGIWCESDTGHAIIRILWGKK